MAALECALCWDRPSTPLPRFVGTPLPRFHPLLRWPGRRTLGNVLVYCLHVHFQKLHVALVLTVHVAVGLEDTSLPELWMTSYIVRESSIKDLAVCIADASNRAFAILLLHP